MKRYGSSLLVAALAVAIASLLYGCGKKASDTSAVIAKVSHGSITADEFKTKIERMPPYYRNIVEKNKKRYLEDLIVERLFYEAAVRKGLNRDKEVIELVNEAKKRIVIGKLIKIEVDDKVRVTDDEARAYYDAHKNEFMTPELWRASHILVANEREAADILAELNGGAKFEDLARQHSMDATASRGGDIGFFRAGQLVPDFEKACFKLSVGQTSGIIHTQFGYHIIKLTDKKEPGAEDFEKAKARIENELRKKRRTELFDKLVADLKSRYGVVIYEAAFVPIETVDPESKTRGD